MRKKIFFYLILLLSASNYILAEEAILINHGHMEPVPIAINNLSSIAEINSTATKITNIIKADLGGSALFKPLAAAAFLEEATGNIYLPLFAAWQEIDATLLTNGELTLSASDQLSLKITLWDVLLENKLLERNFTAKIDDWRYLAHQAANAIYQKYTGYTGYFNSKIAYISEEGTYEKRKKRLAIMDYDGHNHQFLTNGADLVLMPRFSPDGKTILYLSYQNDDPQIYLMNLASKTSYLIGTFPGISFAPRFSPDGKNIIMSIAEDGTTHIYEVNIKNGKSIKLTKGNHINTSPCYSPDGQEIIFNSDRLGSKQLFIMQRNGKNIRRVSFAGGSYSEPDWSSQNYIVFTKISRNLGFTIGILSPTTNPKENNERLITSSYLVETPSWSSNGRVIAFTKGLPPTEGKQQGLSRIFTIDFSGHNEKIIPTPYDASDPTWSP